MKVGTWTKCTFHKRLDVYWMKYTDYPYDFCDLCKYDIQIKNGTLQTNKVIFNRFKNNDSKPEKNSL